MNERKELLEHARRTIDAEDRTILGVLVALEVGGKEALFIRLGADGGVHRLGTGSIERFDRERFIGATSPEAFQKVLDRISPELLAWGGQCRRHPNPRGEICDLLIVLKRADGEEVATSWRFGSLSKWPPAEVLELVDAAVEATCPWYEEQKRRVSERTARAEYEWWPVMARR